MATITSLSDADKPIHVAGNFVTSIDNEQLINQHFLHEHSAIKLFQTTAPTANAVTNNIINVTNFFLYIYIFFMIIIIIMSYDCVLIIHNHNTY